MAENPDKMRPHGSLSLRKVWTLFHRGNVARVSRAVQRGVDPFFPVSASGSDTYSQGGCSRPCPGRLVVRWGTLLVVYGRIRWTQMFRGGGNDVSPSKLEICSPQDSPDFGTTWLFEQSIWCEEDMTEGLSAHTRPPERVHHRRWIWR